MKKVLVACYASIQAVIRVIEVRQPDCVITDLPIAMISSDGVKPLNRCVFLNVESVMSTLSYAIRRHLRIYFSPK